MEESQLSQLPSVKDIGRDLIQFGETRLNSEEAPYDHAQREIIVSQFGGGGLNNPSEADFNNGDNILERNSEEQFTDSHQTTEQARVESKISPYRRND